MKASATRRALLLSILSLVVCCSMLLGTTFAWFTDSATSAGNIIKSGTLDVEMYWADGTKAVPADESSDWIDASTGAIFSYTLWEPGFAQVRHIKIANEGDLALKYKVLIQANGEVSDLSDAIDVYYVDPAEPFADADDLTESKRLGTLTEVLANLGTTGNGTLAAGKSDTITIALVMPEEAGNEYMGKTLGSDFSVIVLATQLAAEEDSFGPDYDAGATYPAVSIPAPIPQGGTAKVTLNTMKGEGAAATGVKVEIPAATFTEFKTNDETKNVTSVALSHSEPKVDAIAKTVSFDAIDIVDQKGQVIDLAAIGNAEPITVTVPVGNAFDNGDVVVVYHDNEPVASATVANGAITYTTTHFCRVDVNFGDGNVDSAAELAAAIAKGGTIVLNADVTLPETVVVPVGVKATLDLNGKTLTVVNETANYAIRNLGDLTILDSVGGGKVVARGIYNGYDPDGNHIATAKLTILSGTYNAKGENGGAAVYNYGVLNVTSGNFTSVGGYALNNQAGGKMSVANASVRGGIYNCGELNLEDTDVYQHISGRHAIYNWAGSVTIDGGIYDSESGNELIFADGQDASVVINDGTFNKTAKSWLFAAATGKNITFEINGGTFNGYVNKPENTVDTVRPFGDKFDITGGTFNFDPTTWVVDDYKAFKNENGTWTVRANAVKVATEEELRAAMAGDLATVTLKNDIVLTETLTISRDVTFNLGGYTLKGVLGTLVKVAGGNVVITNGTLSNEHEKATDTKYSLYLTGDAVAEVKDVTIKTSGTGIYLDGNAKITELNANVDSYFNANGTCAYDAVSVNGNARVDLISGGEYVSRVATEYIEWWNTTHSYSGTNSYALRVNSANASVGEIRGGTFLSGDDRSNTGAIIQVNSGKVELISGGYFGFVKFGLQSPWKVLFANSANGGSINKITGGTYEVYTNKYGCDFAGIVDASDCKIVDTGVDVEVKAQFSSSVKTYVVDVYEVVAK